MKPTKYSTFTLKIFGRFFEKYMHDSLEEKNIELVKADIQMSYEEFYSMAIMSIIISYIISLIFTVVLYVAAPSEITLA